MKSNLTIPQKPAVLKAFSFISTFLDNNSIAPGERLPPIKELAQKSGVSYSSMKRAIWLAKSQKLVTTTRGGYIIAGSDISAANLESQKRGPIFDRGKIWQRKLVSLEQDILNGRYHELGRLPLSKELQNTYGICAPTLKKILYSLAKSGLIVNYKQTWQIAALVNKKRPRNTIVLLSSGVSPERIGYNERIQKLIDALERLSAQSGMKAVLGKIEAGDQNLVTDTYAFVKKVESALGYILDIPWAGSDKEHQRINDLVILLARQGVPLAILDSLGTYSLPPHIAGLAHVRVFRIAAYKAGLQVAQKLLELGHRHIAYISMLHAYEWSVRRLSGLCDRFESAGFPGGVVPYYTDRILEELGLEFWLSDLPREKVVRILSIKGSTSPVLNPSSSTMQRDERMSDARIRNLQTSMAAFGELVDKNIDPDIFENMRDAALSLASLKGSRILAEPLYEKALSHKSITAWVCANDGTAMSALLFLSQHKIRVPGQISVIGFDNHPYALENGLSSYDFNISGILHRIIWFIRQPNVRPAREPGPEEVEGMIIERETTGKAEKRVESVALSLSKC
jgi:DNA-binding LacI/PurR family transcriptional regulator/DNA-binding transcriptional regulator YhcF (GntR family)